MKQSLAAGNGPRPRGHVLRISVGMLDIPPPDLCPPDLGGPARLPSSTTSAQAEIWPVSEPIAAPAKRIRSSSLCLRRPVDQVEVGAVETGRLASRAAATARPGECTRSSTASTRGAICMPSHTRRSRRRAARRTVPAMSASGSPRW